MGVCGAGVETIRELGVKCGSQIEAVPAHRDGQGSYPKDDGSLSWVAAGGYVMPLLERSVWN